MPDQHEQTGLRRNQICWNIAVDENLSPEDITVEEVPEDGYVWEHPMLKLHTHCYKAPTWCRLIRKKHRSRTANTSM